MEPTLDESLKAVFGAVSEVQAVRPPPVQLNLEELSEARTLFDNAQEAMKQGKWEEFGKAMEELKKLLGRNPGETKK
jgi:uncharacterized membrane protein (UPF0182 family)